MIGVILMVHLGMITNAAGADVTALVKSGQYALSDRANDYVNRVLQASRKEQAASGDHLGTDTKVSA